MEIHDQKVIWGIINFPDSPISPLKCLNYTFEFRYVKELPWFRKFARISWAQLRKCRVECSSTVCLSWQNILSEIDIHKGEAKHTCQRISSCSQIHWSKLWHSVETQSVFWLYNFLFWSLTVKKIFKSVENTTSGFIQLILQTLPRIPDFFSWLSYSAINSEKFWWIKCCYISLQNWCK